MEEQKRRARNRKRKSRAIIQEFKADCEQVVREEQVQEDSIQINDERISSNCEHGNVLDHEFQHLQESSLAADLLEAERSTNKLCEDVIAANLQENLEPLHSPSVPESISETDELRRWAIENNINHTSLDRLLSILRKKLLPDLPKSSVTFLQTRNIQYSITEMDDYSTTADPGQFVYFGIGKGLEMCVLATHEENILLIVNVDGLPLSKSGKKTFWPILCRVYNEPDLYKPFVVAIYCGTSKPKSVDEYFSQFIQELNNLQETGIVLHDKKFNVRLMCIAADTPARAYCKGTKGHGGYSACERCVVYGKRVVVGKGAQVVYPGTHYESRTAASFRNRSDPEHHTGNSPLENIVPPVDMTTIFSLDFMHLVCVGVMKKLLEMLIAGPLKVRLSSKRRAELSRRMLSLKAFVPAEFQRKPTSVDWIYKWKATEFRFFLLYCGPIVLRNVLSRNLYRHFLLLHAAFRILCTKNLALPYNHNAKAYLEIFVRALPMLYGEQAQVINMHNLLHVADDAKNFGCSLNQINCFPFESFLGSMKRVLRTPNKPLEQFCSRKSESDMLSGTPFEFPKKFRIDKSVITEGRIYVSQLTINFSTIITPRAPNNVVLLDDEFVMEISEIYGPDALLSSLKIVGKVWKTKMSIYQYPVKSSFFQMWKLPNNASSVTAVYPLMRVVKKILKINLSYEPCGRIKVFFASMLH